MEDRVHKAIDFYDRLLHPDFGINDKLKSYIEFILWEIKTVTEVPSIKKRLSVYNVTPKDIFSQIHATDAFDIMNKDRKSDNTNSNDGRFFSPKRSNTSTDNEGPPKKRLKLTDTDPIEEDTQIDMTECNQGENIAGHTNTKKRPGVYNDKDLPDAKFRKIDKTEVAEEMQMDEPTFFQPN